MVDLGVKNVPDDPFAQLTKVAERRNLSIDEVVISAIEREVKNADWWERWDKSPRIELEIDAAELVREAREENDRKFDDHWKRRRREWFSTIYDRFQSLLQRQPRLKPCRWIGQPDLV